MNNDDYRKQIIKLVQRINEERFLRYLYILLNEIAENENKQEK